MEKDWWCPNCKVALDGHRVTCDERCDTCGCEVHPEGECTSCAEKYARIKELERALQVNNATIIGLKQDTRAYRCVFESRIARLERVKAIAEVIDGCAFVERIERWMLDDLNDALRGE